MVMAGGSTTSQSSGVTGGDLSAFNEQEEISNLELLEKEPMSSEWTDEKHSLYLKSIESLFVHQLYSSMESCGFHSHKKHPSHVSHKQNESHAADQVHHHGCWQRIKFGRGPPQKSAKSRILLQNPWIQHFRSCDNEPIPDNIRICQTEDSSIGEEYSGQNFDEEVNGVRICSLHTTKRMKIVDAVAENHE